ELLEDAGGMNAAGASDLAFFRMSAESAVRAAPEVIVLCGIDAPPGRAPIPGLEKTRARTLRSTALLHPGPRMPEALPDLGAAIGIAIVTVASGRALAAAAASTSSFAGVLPPQLAAVAGAMTAALLVFTLGRSRGALDPARALLTGIVFKSFASALVLSVEAVLRPDQMQAVSLWLAGTLGYEAMPLLAGAGLALLAPVLVLLALAGRLNLLALGDEGAAALGVDVGRTRLFAFFAASAAVGIAVAFTGLVGFVGLIVPHAVRLLTGPDHRVVLPASALGGAAFLVLADALARVLFRGLGAEPPVGAVTAIVGAPLFVLLMRSRR